MAIQMTVIEVERVLFDGRSPDAMSQYEFTIDCGVVYFGAVYDGEGELQSIDQYFYTSETSRDDLEEAIAESELLSVDNHDFPVKTWLLIKQDKGNEWMRFHAVVADQIDPDYFYQKYLGD